MSAGIDIIAVTKTYDGSTLAVDAVDMSIREGEFFSLLGPSGCGKTTTLRMIAGFERPDRGAIRLGGRDLLGLRPHAIARLGVGRTFQTPKLLNHETVLDNVLLGAFPRERASALEIALRLPRARAEARASRADALRYL
ncbi:MAG TPA: ATP-binding cassette domain-containing protein, partial [Bradyrhizobium sp.]